MSWDQLTPLLWEAAGQTAYMVLITLLVGGFLGLALGLGLYLTRPGNLLGNRVVFAVLNLAVNVVRPIPFIIFLVALGPLTRAVIGSTIGIEAFTFAMCSWRRSSSRGSWSRTSSPSNPAWSRPPGPWALRPSGWCGLCWSGGARRR